MTQPAHAQPNFYEESKQSESAANRDLNDRGDIDGTPLPTESAMDTGNRRNSSYLVSETRQINKTEKSGGKERDEELKVRGSPDLKGDYDIEKTNENK